MSLISIVKRITIQPHQEIAYELNNQLFILVVQSNSLKQMQIHIIDEQYLDNKVSQYIVAQLDNQCAYHKIFLEQINQHLSLIILEADRKVDSDHSQGFHFYPWYFFYSFELATRKIKLAYAATSHRQQALRYPLFYELNQQKTLIITDMSKIPEIKQETVEKVQNFDFAHQQSQNPNLIYQKNKSKFWTDFTEFVEDKQHKKKVAFLIKANGKMQLKITDHKEEINKGVIKSSKRISTFQGKIFRMKPYLKIVRIFETTKNALIEKTQLVQYGRSNKTGVLQDTILKITNAEVVAKLGNSHTMISRNQLIARHIYGGDLEIIKIPQE